MDKEFSEAPPERNFSIHNEIVVLLKNNISDKNDGDRKVKVVSEWPHC
jgi:hypothetical protein